MKRIFHYGMAALLSLTATTSSATVLTRTASAESSIQPTQSTLSLSSKAEANLESVGTRAFNRDFNELRSVNSKEFTGTSRRRSAPAKAAQIGDSWTSVGTGKYTDGIICAIFTSFSAYTWDVEIEQNDAAPGVYRLVNPYTCETSPYARYKNSEDNSYMVFDATDPQAVVLIPSDKQNMRTDLCVTLNTYYGSVFVVPSAWWEGDEAGTFKDGNINFPEGTLGACLPGYNPDNWWDSKSITVLLPGAKDYSISVEPLTGICTENGKFRISYTRGEDATNVKWFLAQGNFSANADNLSVVAQSGSQFSYGNGNYTLSCNQDGWYTLFFVSLDSTGNIADYVCIHVFNRIFNADDWTSLGMGLFSDDTFCPDYGVKDKIPAYTVEILESKTKPGVYCLVNPYKDHPALNENRVHNHSDYLVVDASDPEAVYIDEQPIGVNIGGDEITLLSDKYGTLVDHVITFPTRGLVYGDGEKYYYANRSGNFSITIPYFELTVKVVDPEGAAMEGATVSILNVEDADAVTNADGEATINIDKALATGTYIITAYKDGYEMDDTTPVTIDVEDGTFKYSASITLDEAICTLTIIATDEDDEPIEGAYIYFDNEYQEGVTTGANGQAIIEIKGGFGKTYQVMVGKDGYEPFEGEAEFTEGLEAYVFAKLEQSVCTLTIIATDEDDEPIEGAYIYLDNEYQEGVTTGANGQAIIEIKGGFGKTYQVMVGKDGYEPFEGEAEFTEGLETYVFAKLEQSICTATFIILSKDEPVEGATITVEGLEPVTTGANGQAVITIKGGFGKSYTYTVTKEHYNDFTGTLEFNAETGIEASAIVNLEEKNLGINEINADAAAGNTVIYNLQGMRLSKVTEAGCYIVNGHKVMLKH